MNQSEKRLFLIQSLLKERPEYRDLSIPSESDSQRQLLRGLMNIRAPQRTDAEFLKHRTPICKAKPPQRVSRILPASHPSSQVCISGKAI